ncbi:MAG: hypothetical protein JWR20_570 [Marmoricola sp.]|nr:hypothetical protein [Marmoricola sp.]
MSRFVRRDEGGSAAVEFALVIAPLLTIVFGLMQYAVYFYSMQGGADAARQAARLASIGTPTSCSAFTTSVAGSLSVAGAKNVVVTRSYTKAGGNTGTGAQIGDQVTVQVTFDSMNFSLPFVPVPNGGQVESSATTRVDYVPDTTIGACP